MSARAIRMRRARALVDEARNDERLAAVLVRHGHGRSAGRFVRRSQNRWLAAVLAILSAALSGCYDCPPLACPDPAPDGGPGCQGPGCSPDGAW